MKDRTELRRRLGLLPGDAPVLAVPPLPGRDDGHFRAGWATLLLRKGGVPARLLLPAAGRESRRITRFAVAALEPTAIIVVPDSADLSSPLDLLPAADILVVPSQALYDPDAVTRAAALRMPIVAAGLSPVESPMLNETTCLLAASPAPLNLARAVLRLWQDRTLADSLVAAASHLARGSLP